MKNRYEVHGDVVEIFLEHKSKGLKMSTFVSARHLDRLLSLDRTWSPKPDKSGKYFYPGSTSKKNGKNYTLFLHRWIIDAQEGLIVDHINHDTLDNRDENLRQVDKVINGRNRRGANSNNKSSGVRNVVWVKKTSKWMVAIEDRGKVIHVGSYAELKDAEQAAINAREAIYAGKAV